MQTTTGATVGLVGLGLAGVGLWAKREAKRALARERIVLPLAPGSGSDLKLRRDRASGVE
jgi:hypothetical protein